ncbi:hypothetical protein [Streptomyces sp. IBSNAI001]|uniref:hypothetical protein n=1 Tax=Streptomyces sp. IBSNAI001 TaxID=3457499 RepID=UPI003FD348F5
MAQRVPSPDVLSRLARLEREVAVQRRAGWERAELPFYPTSAASMPYETSATLQVVWETVLSPRTGSLSLGLVTIGNVVGGVNTGGEWQVVLADTTVVMNGTIAATFSYQFAAATIDLTPYRGQASLKVQIKARRTSGATTGGVAVAPRYARLT